MKICFITPNNHIGKLPRNFENCRTEFAWQIALNSDHFPINHTEEVKEKYDIAIVILPKKTNLFNFDKLLEFAKKLGKKRTVMQEGPYWYYQDYNYTDQINYINFLSEMDFLLVHNKSDINYFKGLFKLPTT